MLVESTETQTEGTEAELFAWVAHQVDDAELDAFGAPPAGSLARNRMTWGASRGHERVSNHRGTMVA